MWTRHVFDPWVSIQPIGLDGGQVCWIHGLTWVCTFCIALYNFIWGIGTINATCGHLAEISRLTSVIFMVLSVYTSYCSSLGAILEVLWTERGWCVQTTDRDVPLLLRQVCDLLMCPGIALPVHGTNGFKWLPNHWVLHVYFSLARSEGGMGARNAEKSTIFMINFINQHIYITLFVGRSRSSCMKIRPQCRLKPTHLSLKLPTAEIRCTAP